ncbi:MAG TPA: CocE/NonD family hydrolase C-terminal non-catalytic domain-containing protein, partial [Caulobacteraceae bacterium]
NLEILGGPVLRLRLSADRPVAKLAARLVEITAEGESWLVGAGLLNLTHRRSHAEPEPLVPGEAFDVEVQLAAIAHRFRAGSRIGLALSESLWPLVWPSPEIVTLTLSLGETSTLTFPVRPIEPEPAAFDIPEVRTPPGDHARRPTAVTAPVSPGVYRIELDSPATPTLLRPTDTLLGRGRLEVSEITESDPNSCIWTHRASSTWKRGDWDCAVEAACELRSTAEDFILTESLTARRGDEIVFERSAESRIKRRLV